MGDEVSGGRCCKPYLADEPFAFTPEYTGASIDYMLNGMNELVFKGLIPADSQSTVGAGRFHLHE
ncbi:MAG TPA: hypothetical protein VFF06_33850 [Polyangia bacterium]|nr:hypothetical protein [Polyangia bacterium]